MERLPREPDSAPSSAQAIGQDTILSGSVEYTQTFVYKPDQVLGTATGDLVAHFDGLGLVRPAVGAQTATADNL